MIWYLDAWFLLSILLSFMLIGMIWCWQKKCEEMEYKNIRIEFLEEKLYGVKNEVGK